MNQDKFAKLEWELVYLAGPLVKFVINQQIKNMGFTREDFPEDRFGELIDKVVDNGIYDNSAKAGIKKQLKKKLL